MANNKLSWTELRRALATRAGISEKEANLFLNALNAQLIEGLKKDKQVKINGLGMFRLQAVAPRKSVHVTTGEDITIKGYNKLAFVPEAGVKELVESGVPSAEVRSEIDPIQKLGAQAEEIVDILGELGQSPTAEEPKVEEPKAEEPKVEAPKAEKPKAAKKPKAEKPKAEEPKIEEPKAEEPKVEEPKAEEPKVEEPKVVEPEPKVDKAPKKPYHFVRDTLICVVILLMLLLIGYFFLRNQISNWIEGWANPQEKELVVDAIVLDEAEISEIPEMAETNTMVAAEEEEIWDGELLLTENITAGSRLAWIAKKHYGNRVYWPYLYEANKDHINNPSQITIGTPIRVPKLSAAQRDTTSERFLRLKEEAYSAVRER